MLEKGQQFGSVEYPPITRLTLALYAGGSGDHNPLHVDFDFARANGYDDVIAHGMLVMSYLGRFLTGLFPQKSLRSFQVRFRAMTHVGDRISCGGEVVDLIDAPDGGKQARLNLWAVNQNNEVKLSGSCLLSVSR